MPLLKSQFVLDIARGVKLFFNLNAGVTRGRVPDSLDVALDAADAAPDSSGVSVEQLQDQIQRQRQRNRELREQLQSVEEPGVVEARANASASRNAFRPVERTEVLRGLLSTMKPGRVLELGPVNSELSGIVGEFGGTVDSRETGTRGVGAGEGYDCICILDLFHRLTLSEQLDLLRECAGIATILDTPVSMKPAHEERGYGGHLHREAPPEETTLEGEVPDAGHSFWPTEESLVRMIHDSGFTTVFKLEPYHAPDRTTYLCL